MLGKKSVKVWVIAIDAMKMARIIGEKGRAGEIINRRITIRFMWIPGMRPVIVPAKIPKRRAISSRSIKKHKIYKYKFLFNKVKRGQMKKIRFRLKVKHMLFIIIAISFLASYFFPGVEKNETIQTSITFIGILFSIIVGFFITDLYARYQAIRINAAEDSSSLTTFYSLAKILGQNKKNKKWLEKVRESINKYVLKFMPTPWEKYDKTEPEFQAIVDSLQEIKYDTNKENETYSNILAVVSAHSTAREKLVMYGRDKLSWGEQLVIAFLGVLLLGSLFYVKDTTMTSTVFTGALASAILILLFVVRDLNNLNIGENAVSIVPYERVLDAIGKPRYYRKREPAEEIGFGKTEKKQMID